MTTPYQLPDPFGDEGSTFMSVPTPVRSNFSVDIPVYSQTGGTGGVESFGQTEIQYAHSGSMGHAESFGGTEFGYPQNRSMGDSESFGCTELRNSPPGTTGVAESFGITAFDDSQHGTTDDAKSFGRTDFDYSQPGTTGNAESFARIGTDVDENIHMEHCESSRVYPTFTHLQPQHKEYLNVPSTIYEITSSYPHTFEIPIMEKCRELEQAITCLEGQLDGYAYHEQVYAHQHQVMTEEMTMLRAEMEALRAENADLKDEQFKVQTREEKRVNYCRIMEAKYQVVKHDNARLRSNADRDLSIFQHQGDMLVKDVEELNRLNNQLAVMNGALRDALANLQIKAANTHLDLMGLQSLQLPFKEIVADSELKLEEMRKVVGVKDGDIARLKDEITTLTYEKLDLRVKLAMLMNGGQENVGSQETECTTATE